MKKILITLFLVLSSLRIVYAQDVVVGEDYSTDVVTINEELRKVNSDIKKIYPVGSIYINASVDTNPATLLGFGTWAAFAAGRVLVGIDAGQTEFDAVEETGGEKTHTLTTPEIPAHTHNIAQSKRGGYIGNNEFYTIADGGGTPNTNKVSESAGGGGAHNNLQPYIVVYMWKRTA